MIKNILTRKCFILLLLLTFILPCFAMESSINGYLKEGGKENNANFKDEAAYLNWIDTQNKPRIVIVGSGRGGIEIKNYANSAYLGKEYDYLLVNYTKISAGQETKPDIDLDIREIGELKEGAYDYCIFENVDFNVSFSKQAIQGALKILKPDGKLITSNYPMFHFNYSEKLFNNTKKLYPSSFELSDGYAIVYNDKEVCNYLSNKLATSHQKEQDFLNTNKQKFIIFFELQSCKDISFVDIKIPDAKMWPSALEAEDDDKKSVLIFTKK